MSRRVIIVGGGAAGMFAAVTAAEAGSNVQVTVLEKSRDLLQKVGISGGGRCNVTHDCRDPRALTRYYPRGERELRGMFARFTAQDTIDWFAARGVVLKTEADGRVFPTTDRSETVIGCLVDAARAAGVEILTKRPVRGIELVGDRFDVALDDGTNRPADRLLIATGGMRGDGARALVESVGHGIVEPVPSLFTFHVDDERLSGLAGLAVENAGIRAADIKGVATQGPLLVTHWGLSGPGVLKLSALGARDFADRDYEFDVLVDWLPGTRADAVIEAFACTRRDHPRKQVVLTPPALLLPRRLWGRLVAAAGVPDDRVWTELRRQEARDLAAQLGGSRFRVDGKSLNKDEFVTCGGVPLAEVDLRRMESRKVPGLYFAGEILDIDGVTGGFNLQAAWTGGWIAGHAMVA